ncbi:MAG: dienelactone hydrolase family protein [Burkholderiales bacterium]|nr:dienelactone hydrolase family protein [Burkholderiales bacterium]
MQRRGLIGALLCGPLAAEPLDAWLLSRQRSYAARLAWRPSASWRSQALSVARRLILQPGDDGRAIDTERLATEPRGDHVAHRLRLRMALGDSAEALWLLPARPGPHPAVLLLHDHGARFDIGAEKLVRPLASDAPAVQEAAGHWVARYFDGRFVGEALVRQGYAVLAVDALGWGSRSRPGFARDDQQALAAQLMQLGAHWAGVIASDDLRSLRWLRERSEVDARRIAVFGFSMGAFRAWQLAALDEGVEACIAAHWMAPRRDGLLRPGEHTLLGQSAFAMLHPGLAAELDHPDVAALVAPRPFLLMGSPQDRLFPWDAAQRAAAQLAQAWPQGGFRFESTRGGHQFGAEAQAAAWAWLRSLRER